jgi:hypothetical protein
VIDTYTLLGYINMCPVLYLGYPHIITYIVFYYILDQCLCIFVCVTVNNDNFGISEEK